MKRVFLLRHGKSDWDAAYGGDHERPLKSRGVRAARTMGRFLADTEQIPDIVVSSSAVRARTTAELAAEAGEWDRDVRVEEGLYGAGPQRVLEEIRSLSDDFESVLLAGHEPTFSGLTGQLVGSAQVRFPTAAVARIDFAVSSWDEVNFGRGTLIWFAPARLLSAAGVSG